MNMLFEGTVYHALVLSLELLLFDACCRL